MANGYVLTIVQEAAPLTGETVTITNTTTVLIVNPAGALLALTLNFPTGKYDGAGLEIIFTQAITTITTSGTTLLTALASSTLGLTRKFVWSSTLSKWC